MLPAVKGALMLTITVPNIDYHRPVKRTYPVTVHCPRCKALEDMDAEFIDGKFYLAQRPCLLSLYGEWAGQNILTQNFVMGQLELKLA
jgi:hypothetical protein